MGIDERRVVKGSGWQFWKNREIKQKRRDRYEKKESQQPLITYAINLCGNGSLNSNFSSSGLTKKSGVSTDVINSSKLL